jgi:hypothetical protein
LTAKFKTNSLAFCKLEMIGVGGGSFSALLVLLSGTTITIGLYIWRDFNFLIMYLLTEWWCSEGHLKGVFFKNIIFNLIF